MLVLDVGDKIQGDASAATIVDYTLHGMVGSTLTQLADGQLAATKTDIYTAASIVVVSTITIVNTDTVARTINLYLLPSAGTARRIIAKNLTLEAGYSLHYDGVKANIVVSASGKQHPLWLPAEAAYLPVTNPAALVEAAGATVYAGWSYLAFDDTTSEHAVWRIPMPDYDGGNIVVTAFSRPATTPAGAVTLQYDILTIGLANSEAFNSAVTVDTGVNISHSLNTTELSTDICVASTTIDPANVSADDLMVIELARDVVTDTLVGDGQLVGILIEYTKA